MSTWLLLPNYALESVKAWQGCAADAGKIVAPAALGQLRGPFNVHVR